MKPVKKIGRTVLNKIAARPKFIKLSQGGVILATGNMAWSYKGGHYYEVNVDHWLNSLVRSLKEPVFYDIGANLGYYSVTLAKFAKQVYSFEPSSKTRANLRLNLQMNNRENVTVFPYGLSDKKDTANLNIYSSNGNNSLFKRALPEGHSLKLRRTQSIQLRRLDDLIAEEKMLPPKLIKIDVEGGELAVLKGARQTLVDHTPVILFEYSIETAKDAGYSRTQLTNFLKKLGYVFFGLSTELNDLKLYPLTQSKVDIDNVIAVHQGNKALLTKLRSRQK